MEFLQSRISPCQLINPPLKIFILWTITPLNSYLEQSSVAVFNSYMKLLCKVILDFGKGFNSHVHKTVE